MGTNESAPAAANAGTTTDTRSMAYAIAARALADHRPIAAWLRGERELPRGAVGERIALAAAALGAVPITAPPKAA